MGSAGMHMLTKHLLMRYTNCIRYRRDLVHDASAQLRSLGENESGTNPLGVSV